MDTTPSLDKESLGGIREQIEQTRASLGKKLESLETEVRSSVLDASQSVRERIDRIKRAFDVDYQVKEYPWVSVSLAFGVGFILSGVRFGPRNLAGLDSQDPSNLEKGVFRGWLQQALRADRPRMRALSYDIGAAVLKEILHRTLLSHVSQKGGSAKQTDTEL